MSLEKLKSVLAFDVYDIEKRGTSKSDENIVTGVIKPAGGKGRVILFRVQKGLSSSG